VPDNGEIPHPEQLSNLNKKDAEPIMDLFDQYTIQCLYSRHWILRVQALREITSQITTREDKRILFQGICRIIKRCLSDKVTQVTYATNVLLETSMNYLVSSVKIEEVRVMLEPIVSTMLEKVKNCIRSFYFIFIFFSK
jgi:hypothetical protein